MTTLTSGRTRTAVRPAGTRSVSYATESTVGTPNLANFRSHVKALFADPPGRQIRRRERVVSLLRESSDPRRFVGELLDACYHQGSPAAKEVATAILSETKDRAVDYLRNIPEPTQPLRQSPHLYRTFILDVIAEVIDRSDAFFTVDRNDLQSLFAGTGSQPPANRGMMIKLIKKAFPGRERAEFRQLLERLYSSRGNQRKEQHAEAVARLKASRNPYPLVEELLGFCVARRSEEGLDVGTDILAGTGPLSLHFAQRYLAQDTSGRSDTSKPGELASDDRWTILIRAASRGCDDKSGLLVLLQECLASGSRSVQETVVEGLQAVGTPQAVGLLQELAQGKDPLVARIASQALDDLAEG